MSDLHAHPEKPDQQLVDPWFLVAGDHDREDGDGEVTRLPDPDGRAEFLSGDPATIEDTIGIPRGALAR